MINTSYTLTITVSKSERDVFNSITNLSEWWVEEFIGEKLKLNSEFILKISESHFSKNKVIEFVSYKIFVWITTESERSIYNFDWSVTKMIFELSAKDDKSIIKFTHQGLVPGKECYESCELGWNTVIKDYLFNYITYGKVAEQLYH
jgi:hypothetical protein